MKLSQGFPCKEPCKDFLITLCQNSLGCDGPFLLPCDSSCNQYKTIGEVVISKETTLFTERDVRQKIKIKKCDSCAKEGEKC